MSSRTWRPAVWATAIAALLACTAVMVAMAAETAPPLVMVNETPSLPRGVYLRSSQAGVARGAIVAIAQPAAARSYLASLEVPPDMWILKRVAGKGGDRACAMGGTLAIAGRRAPVFLRDQRGRPLPRWEACRALAPGELFLLGDTPTSFDSRYFGPVRAEAVAGIYREVLTW